MIVIGCSNSVQFVWWFAQPTQSCFALGEENFPYAEIPQNLGFGLLKRGKITSPPIFLVQLSSDSAGV